MTQTKLKLADLEYITVRSRSFDATTLRLPGVQIVSYLGRDIRRRLQFGCCLHIHISTFVAISAGLAVPRGLLPVDWRFVRYSSNAVTDCRHNTNGRSQSNWECVNVIAVRRVTPDPWRTTVGSTRSICQSWSLRHVTSNASHSAACSMHSPHDLFIDKHVGEKIRGMSTSDGCKIRCPEKRE